MQPRPISDAEADDFTRGAAAARDAARDARRLPSIDAGSLDGREDAAAAPDAAVTRDRSASAAPPDAADDDALLPGWRLVWRDEFEGVRGALPSPARWAFDMGGHGFGNNQLEFDTARAKKAALDGAGRLVITARREDYMGKRYTSARLKTQGKFGRAYDRYEARMQLPRGQGIWACVLDARSDIDRRSWPACGEIDIMENIGREPSRIHGTLHPAAEPRGRWAVAGQSGRQHDLSQTLTVDYVRVYERVL